MKFIIALPIVIIELLLVGVEIIIKNTKGLFSTTRIALFKEYDYREWLRRDLAGCESILELGCGSNSPILHIGYGKKTDAIDIWQPYVEKHNRLGNYHNCWQGDILELVLPFQGYDAVVIFDVLEHLSREEVEASDLFANMKDCARKKVIIFSPNGFFENDKVDDDPWQKHLSAWEPEDYSKRGYEVVGATGLRHLFGEGSLPKYRPHAACAIIGMVSKPLVFHKPKLATHSYAVKILEVK